MSPAKRLQQVLLIGAAGFLAILACGGPGLISHSQVNLQPPLTNAGLNFDEFLRQVGAFPRDRIPLAWITQPVTPAASGSVTVAGWAPNRQDRPTENRPDQKPIVTVYEMRPNGCGVPFAKGRVLAQAEVNDDRTWTTDITASPGMIVAATVTANGREGDPGNLVVFDQNALVPTVEIPGADVSLETDRIDFSGRAGPGFCVLLQRESVIMGRQAAGQDGNWIMPRILLNQGANTFQLRLERPEVEQPLPIIVTAFTIQLDWPLWRKESETSDKYIPDARLGGINAWYGPNDFHIVLLGITGHQGLDIAPGGDEIARAVAAGTVFTITNTCADCGNMVVIDHGEWASFYMHLANDGFDAANHRTQYRSVGDPVQAGDPLAPIGNTGLSIGRDGRHLHLEIRRWPENWRTSKTGKQMRVATPININPVYTPEFCEAHNLKGYWGEQNYWNINWRDVTINYLDGTRFNRIGCGLGEDCPCARQ